MIIIGYPGIGKSTLANNYYDDIKGCYKGLIDLESSCFYNENPDPLRERDGRDRYWYIPYCKVALDLSKQGYVVFVSSHEAVCRELTKALDEVKVCYPSVSLKDEWVLKLRNRYLNSTLEKDHRAYERAIDHYENDIKALMGYGFDRVEITDAESYVLGELLGIQEGPKCIGY